MPKCQFDSRRAEIKRNLSSLYARAQPIDIEDGEFWYATAQHIVAEWAGTYRLYDTTVACVIAALSPQCEWTRNLIIADDILAGRNPSIGGALHACIRKAEILRDTCGATLLLPIADRMRLVFPCGPKVNSFAQNLAGDMNVVTIDSHACQAGLNDPTADYRLGWYPYSVFADCYREMAHKVGRKPAVFQAILWHTWKALYPRKAKNHVKRLERNR